MVGGLAEWGSGYKLGDCDKVEAAAVFTPFEKGASSSNKRSRLPFLFLLDIFGFVLFIQITRIYLQRAREKRRVETLQQCSRLLVRQHRCYFSISWSLTVTRVLNKTKKHLTPFFPSKRHINVSFF